MRQGWTRTRGAACVTLGVVGVLSLSACNFSANLGSQSVDREEVADQAAAILAEQVGETPDEVTCEEDLPAEVDASIRCNLTHEGTSYGVTVTTTSVDGDDVAFDVEVDDESAG